MSPPHTTHQHHYDNFSHPSNPTSSPPIRLITRTRCLATFLPPSTESFYLTSTQPSFHRITSTHSTSFPQNHVHSAFLPPPHNHCASWHNLEHLRGKHTGEEKRTIWLLPFHTLYMKTSRFTYLHPLAASKTFPPKPHCSLLYSSLFPSVCPFLTQKLSIRSSSPTSLLSSLSPSLSVNSQASQHLLQNFTHTHTISSGSYNHCTPSQCKHIISPPYVLLK